MLSHLNGRGKVSISCRIGTASPPRCRSWGHTGSFRRQGPRSWWLFQMPNLTGASPPPLAAIAALQLQVCQGRVCRDAGAAAAVVAAPSYSSKTFAALRPWSTSRHRPPVEVGPAPIQRKRLRNSNEDCRAETSLSGVCTDTTGPKILVYK